MKNSVLMAQSRAVQSLIQGVGERSLPQAYLEVETCWEKIKHQIATLVFSLFTGNAFDTEQGHAGL